MTAATLTKDIRRQNSKSQPNAESGFASARDQFMRNIVCDSAFRLLPTPIRVGITLALHANHGEFLATKQMFAWPSISRIAQLLELRTDTTVSALQELVQAGHIRMMERGRYRLFPTAEKPPVEAPRNSKPVQRDILSIFSR